MTRMKNKKTFLIIVQVLFQILIQVLKSLCDLYVWDERASFYYVNKLQHAQVFKTMWIDWLFEPAFIFL